VEPRSYKKASEENLEPKGQRFLRPGTEVGIPKSFTSPPMHLSKCFFPSQEVFSCNCLKDPGRCSLPHHSAWPPADEDSKFPGYKRGGSVRLRNAEYGRQGCL
jgi:hypothetical protein